VQFTQDAEPFGGGPARMEQADEVAAGATLCRLFD
jgi:hypothetical protein